MNNKKVDDPFGLSTRKFEINQLLQSSCLNHAFLPPISKGRYMSKIDNRNQLLAKLLRHIDRLHLRAALRGPSEENVYVAP